ncbi:MAG: DMT family transporter [Vibrionaceae bacterium]|nr:DMT family transporter [Vibrionaceae bacterium]
MFTFLLTVVVMFAFAANSLLIRAALVDGLSDAGSFTLIRLISGSVTLVFFLLITGTWHSEKPTSRFKVLAGVTLFGYAVLISYAYLNMNAGTGALLLFGAVQLTLLTLHWWQGERFRTLEVIGIAVSILGFAWLMLPSATRPDVWSTLLMVISGVCWALFTALGKHAPSPSSGIAWGFIAASGISLLVSPFLLSSVSLSIEGISLAITSGVLASGIGYLLWYHVMQKLTLLQAAISQLSVPVIALVLGYLLLNESLSLHSIVTSAIILGGITLVFLSRAQSANKE